MTKNKDLNKVIKNALKRGWVLIRSKRHLIYKYINGETVIVSSTPSDNRAFIWVEKEFLMKEKKVC